MYVLVYLLIICLPILECKRHEAGDFVHHIFCHRTDIHPIVCLTDVCWVNKLIVNKMSLTVTNPWMLYIINERHCTTLWGTYKMGGIGNSLVAQWLRVSFAMQGTQVWSLAGKLVSHIPRSNQALALRLLSLHFATNIPHATTKLPHAATKARNRQINKQRIFFYFFNKMVLTDIRTRAVQGRQNPEETSPSENHPQGHKKRVSWRQEAWRKGFDGTNIKGDAIYIT